MNLINDSELLGLGNLPPQAPAKMAVRSAMRAKTGTVSTTNATGKAMFEQMMFLLPPDTQQAIKTGRLQLVDEILYSIKAADGMNDFYLMESGDNKEVGVTNVDKQKIAANKWTLLCGIQLLSNNIDSSAGLASAPAPETKATGKANLTKAIEKATKFGVIHKLIQNGEFELNVGSTVIVPNISCTVFDTSERTDVLPGLWMGFDPQFITPNTEIKPRLKLPAKALPTDFKDLVVYFGMHCVSIEKN